MEEETQYPELARASEWKRKSLAAAVKDAEPLRLPSGMTIMARRPEPLQLAFWGALPLGLAAKVQGGAGTPSAQEIIASVELSRDVLAYCCVRPRISLKPVPDFDDEIHPKDISMEDTLFILRWARRGEDAETLGTFRGERKPAGSGSDGEDVRHAAIIDAEDRRSGAGAGSGPGGSDEPPVSLRVTG